jgi:hypothetical protein
VRGGGAREPSTLCTTLEVRPESARQQGLYLREHLRRCPRILENVQRFGERKPRAFRLAERQRRLSHARAGARDVERALAVLPNVCIRLLTESECLPRAPRVEEHLR